MNIFRDWTFSWREMGLVKIGLISLGILLGLYFHDQLAGLLYLWWILFVAIAVYFIVRFFKEQ